jgi:predicted transcriptional regulator
MMEDLKMKLYEISQEYQQLFSYLEESNFDQQTIENTLAPLKKTAEEKSKSVAAFIGNINNDLLSLKEHKKNIESRIKNHETKIENLKNYLKMNMETLNITSIKCPEFDILIRNNPPKLIIDNESNIPSEFIKIEYIIDKENLKKAIKEGLFCDGVHIESGKTLIINIK